ncbi:MULTISPECIES: FliI/YscN family ATPase [unclassified Sphingomonas]|uniref:FliI/YscN family ATPase n=1 Tax=unclassified Sphingomonas TaxID=196159 RepID=UPI000AC3568D|nr:MULTISPECIES: FliI/YscN family ATPase [unclassified Sphingomonas]
MNHPFLTRLAAVVPTPPEGRLRKVGQGQCVAVGPDATLGDLCAIERDDGGHALAEVIAVDGGELVLVPLEQEAGLRPGARLWRSVAGGLTPVGNGFVGRAIDALGRPIDGGPPVVGDAQRPIVGRILSPMERTMPHRVVETGIRAIDGLLTLGVGQRIGIFAASGVGKTSLMEQIVTQTGSDRCVLCLVGERGKEVEAIWRVLSARRDAARFTLVAATSDQSASLRARASGVALAIAEHWRDQGEHVLLTIDSVTRLAMALREIGLAAGEPPTVRAYTPNVFAALPRLVERCGAAASGGAITAVMTVLAESDEIDDPVAEVMKSLLDGHILLSRTLAERGQFPAIDLSRSISRQATRLMEPAHAAAARRAGAMLGVYDEARILIESGMVQPGASAEIDAAIALRPGLLDFLQQGQAVRVAFRDAVAQLVRATARG